MGRLSHLDQPTMARLLAGCHFIDAEIARLRNRVVGVAIGAFAIAAAVYVFAFRHGGVNPLLEVLPAIGVTTLVVRNARRELKQEFKAVVVRRVVSAIGRELAYSPTSALGIGHFRALRLFTPNADLLTSEDEVVGRRNGVRYTMSECRAEVVGSRDKSGRPQSTRTVFHGLVVCLEFNKNFNGHTIVVPDRASHVLGGVLGDAAERDRLNLVKLEDPDFEQQFSVYSTDDQQARYILTPKLMQLVLETHARLGTEIQMCFRANLLFVTVASRQDHFEASLFGGPVRPEDVAGDLASVIALAEQLIDTLDLETRIWTRA